MSMLKVYCKIETSPWALTLTEPGPEPFELPASDWPQRIFFWPISEDEQPVDSDDFLHDLVFLVDRWIFMVCQNLQYLWQICCKNSFIDSHHEKTMNKSLKRQGLTSMPARFSLNLRASLKREFSSEYFTEMLLSYIFGPRVVKCGILSNNRHSKLHAFIDCQLF